MDNKKLFALASFTAIAGVLVAATSGGCSSSTTSVAGTDGGKTDGGKTPPGPPPGPPPGTPPPAPPPDDGGGDDAGGGCPTTTPINPADLPYNDPAAAQVGKCTEAELTAFNAAVPTAKDDAALKASVSAACAACIFADAKGPWAPLPESGVDLVTINVGGCYQLVTNNKACGQAIQNRFDCHFVACDGCPAGDQTALSNCIKKSDTGVCKTYATATQTNCGAIDQATLDRSDRNCNPAGAKYVYEGPVRVQCITGVTDAGGP